jgi:hypothetical protein
MATSSLIVTPGAIDANAYVSLAVADQYHLDRPPADNVWPEAVYPAKTQAILWATKLLDRLVPWTGSRVNDTQALKWPRYGMYNSRWVAIPSDAIPKELEEATAEYARHLLTSKVASDPSALKSQLEELADSARKLGVSQVNTPNVSITLEERQSAPVTRVPAEVFDLLPQSWLVSSASVVELLRA